MPALRKALPVQACAWLVLAGAAPEGQGATHAEVGAYLLGLWGLPFQIVEAVANHHAPERGAAMDQFLLTRQSAAAPVCPT